MKDYCYNENCKKQLDKKHVSWFCSEECKEKYWSNLTTKKPKTIKEMQQKLYEMKLYYQAQKGESYATSYD